MGIGLGVVLLLVGLVLLSGVVPDVDFVQDYGLGWILVIVGALAIILALVMNKQRSETRHVEEHRHQGPTE